VGLMPVYGVWGIGLIAFAAFGVFAVSSWTEGEKRASWVSVGCALAVAVSTLLLSLAPEVIHVTALAFAMLGVLVSVGLLLLPRQPVQDGRDAPVVRMDERDIMFARARLSPGSVEYDAYYEMRPEKKMVDDKIRALPGLLKPGSARFHPLAFRAARASFSLTEALRYDVDGAIAQDGATFAPEEITEFVRSLARFWGAHSVGVTEVRPYHVYSVVGRGTGGYGAPIHLGHKFAVAFTVEMSLDMVGSGPHGATVMESARRYVQAADIGLQMAYFIRSLGYEARAHIDGNYQVIAPLVARDAGLGEIGRMGILMTPHLGPRVRLGVVTTNLPMIPDERQRDDAVLDFCRICKKCADNCPSRAIPFDDRREIDGALRWRIESEACFRYWNSVGTDCGRCIAVCPYAHADTVVHSAVRWAGRQSSAARRILLALDDVFYGRRPSPRRAPRWIPPA
jgi:ferredoxin